MSTTSKRRALVAATVLATVAIASAALFVGCSSGDKSDSAASSSDATATQASESMLSLEEYAELYPLQTTSWLQKEDGKRGMGAMHERWSAFIEQVGGNGIPIICGSCHIANYKEIEAAYADDPNFYYMTEADFPEGEIEWMGCGVCHDADLEAGVSPHTSYSGNFVDDLTAVVPEEDAVCGQCHMVFPSMSYVLPENSNQNTNINLYKYGTDPDSILKAFKEAWEDHPVELTDADYSVFCQVGLTWFDPEIGCYIYNDDNCNMLELFQGSNHQSMGLTCTDCHMPKATAEDGTEYTNHYGAGSPLDNPDALEFCLTCHKSQGIESQEAMVEFVRGKIAEMSETQAQLEADVAGFREVLAAAVANGTTDPDKLAEAQDCYTTASYYYYFMEACTDSDNEGRSGVHNWKLCMELYDKAEALIAQGEAALA